MHITLVPYGGLCNRLNSIAAGVAYMKNNPQADMRILWFKYWHCHCRFRDLFKPLPPGCVPVEELTWQLKDIPGHKSNLYIPHLFRGIWYDFSFLPGMSADSFDELTEGKERVYIYHENRFCKVSDAILDMSYADLFRPVDDLQERIDAVTGDWAGSYVVGLHIRRTDNVGAISGSPDEFFYNAVEFEMAEHPDVRFYVASDDESVKRGLKDRYGDRIITFPLCLKRNSVQGMKDAVVDLFCLGSTRKIYGSMSSSYSNFAGKLYGIEVIKSLQA